MRLNQRAVMLGRFDTPLVFNRHTGVPTLRGFGYLGDTGQDPRCVPGANCPLGNPTTTVAPYSGGVCSVGAVMGKYASPPSLSRGSFQPSTDANVFTTPSYIKELNWAGMVGTAIDNNNLAWGALNGDVQNFVANGCLGTPPNAPNYQNPSRADFETYWARLTNNGTGFNSTVVPSTYGLPGGVGVSNTYTPPSQAYGGQVVTPAPTTTPTTGGGAVNNTNTGGSNTSGGNTQTAATANSFSFLTDSAFGGIPNWALLAGGLGAVILLPSLLNR